MVTELITVAIFAVCIFVLAKQVYKLQEMIKDEASITMLRCDEVLKKTRKELKDDRASLYHVLSQQGIYSVDVESLPPALLEKINFVERINMLADVIGVEFKYVEGHTEIVKKEKGK